MNEQEFTLYEKNGSVFSIGMEFKNLLREAGLPAMIGGGDKKHKKMKNHVGSHGIPIGLSLLNKQYGDKSAKIYIEGDCINLKFKWIKLSYHKDKMGKDYAKVQIPSNIVSDWQYPVQNSTSMAILDFVCKNKGFTL